MRRNDRENNAREFIDAVLHDAPFLNLALNGETFPYVVTVNHFMHEGYLCFHCAGEGRKLDLLKADPRVAFSVVADPEMDGTTMRYRSVCGTGFAELVEDATWREAALHSLAAWYKAPCEFPLSRERISETMIVRIRIESMTGKWSRRK